MTNEQTSTLVLKDTAGNYFLISSQIVEQGRVPEERKAEIEQAIAATQGGAGGDDVQGHIFLIGVAIGYFGTKAIINATRDEPGLTVGEYHQRMRGVGEGLQQRSGGSG
jgi:hypothetical protein